MEKQTFRRNLQNNILFARENGKGLFIQTTVPFVCIESHLSPFIYQVIKDIVQPKKSGVKKSTNRFISTSYTIADVL